MVSESKHESPSCPNLLWLEGDLANAREAARDVLRITRDLILRAQKPGPVDFILRAQKPGSVPWCNLYHAFDRCLSSAKEHVHAMIPELNAARERIGGDLPCVYGLTDSTAHGLCVAIATRVDEVMIGKLDADGSWVEGGDFYPGMKRVIALREFERRLQGLEAPDPSDLLRLVDEEAGEAQAARIRNRQGAAEARATQNPGQMIEGNAQAAQYGNRRIDTVRTNDNELLRDAGNALASTAAQPPGTQPPGTQGVNERCDRRCKDVAEQLMREMNWPPSYRPRAQARLSRAIKRGDVKTNGKNGRERRLEQTSVDAWLKRERDKDLDAED